MSVKNRTYYFFNDLIYIKDFDPNDIRIDEKYSFLLYWICDHRVNYSVNPLYLFSIK